MSDDHYTSPGDAYVVEAAAALTDDEFSALFDTILAWLFGEITIPALRSPGGYYDINEDDAYAWQHWRDLIPLITPAADLPDQSRPSS